MEKIKFVISTGGSILEYFGMAVIAILYFAYLGFIEYPIIYPIRYLYEMYTNYKTIVLIGSDKRIIQAYSFEEAEMLTGIPYHILKQMKRSHYYSKRDNSHVAYVGADGVYYKLKETVDYEGEYDTRFDREEITIKDFPHPRKSKILFIDSVKELVPEIIIPNKVCGNFFPYLF